MIDYEQLVKALRCKRDDCEGCDLAFFDKDEGWMCRYAAKDDDAADVIEALQYEIRESMQKCAECGANEPKRGEWIKDEEQSQKHVEAIYTCSACHNFDAWGVTELYPYCPNCGAKMEVQE